MANKKTAKIHKQKPTLLYCFIFWYCHEEKANKKAAEINKTYLFSLVYILALFVKKMAKKKAANLNKINLFLFSLVIGNKKMFQSLFEH